MSRSGEMFEGCGWPEYGWCDVEPGCAGAKEASAPGDELVYDGWDECLPGELPPADTAALDAGAVQRAGEEAGAVAKGRPAGG